MKQKITLILVLAGLVTACYGQKPGSADSWKWLTGEWKGEGSGQPGQGGGTFSFIPDLNNKIIVRKSHSEYITEQSKTPVIHEDLMVIYADQEGNFTRAIYFDNEGHTINYSISFSEREITLTSDKTAGIPVFRLTYTLLDAETVNTSFEISRDGTSFSRYIEGKSKKMK